MTSSPAPSAGPRNGAGAHAVRRRLDLDTPVPRELVLECVEIAREAPSRPGVGAMRFAVVDDREIIGRIAALFDRVAEHLREAPMLVMGSHEAAPADGRPTRAPAGVFGNVPPAVWSFTLAARARGLATAWAAAHGTCLTPVAYAVGGDAGQPRRRRDLRSRTHEPLTGPLSVRYA